MDKPRKRSRWVVRERWHRRARLAGILGAGVTFGMLVEDGLARGGGVGGRALLFGLVTVLLGGLLPWWTVRWIGRRIRHHRFDR